MTSNRVRVLSIQSSNMGHRSFAQQLRWHAKESDAFALESAWSDQERTFWTRGVCWVLGRRLPVKYFSDHNLDFYRFRAEIGTSYMARQLAKRRIDHIKPEVLHFHTQSLSYCSLDLMRRIPTVISGDMTAYQVAAEKSKASWTLRPNIVVEKRVFDAASHVVFWSEWARQSGIKDHRLPDEKVSVVYPGAPIDYFRNAEANARRGSGRPKILFVGADFARKGGYDLLEVFAERFAKQAELHLVTAEKPGSGHPNVIVHSNVRAYTPEWRDLFCGSDLFVLPAYREPFGLVILEALAAGLPVVATNVSAIPEMVIDGENGFLVTPGDRAALANKIARLLDDADQRQSMSQKARAVAETKFNVENNTNALCDIFKSAGCTRQGDQPSKGVV